MDYTPTPWRMDPDPTTINVDRDEELYTVDGEDGTAWGCIVATELRKHDAALIAAAPEMREKLEELVSSIEGGSGVVTFQDSYVEELKALLDKTEGEKG